MRTAFLWLAVSAVAGAQISVKVTSRTATQAVLQIRGVTAPCTIDLRESAADGALHPDVSASVDTSRPDTLTWRDGTRIVTLGHQRGNLALATDTDYYGTVSGCGAASFTFRTKPPALGSIMPTPLPVSSANWNNADFPAIDWSPAGRDKWYTDPITGIRLKIVNRPEDFSWMNKVDQTFAHWAGGTGWTNPANVLNGSTSTAQTANTNPLFLYAPLINPWATNQMTIENIGLLVWGRCVSGSGANCDIEIGITYHPSEGFAGTPITIRMPSGSMTKLSGSTHTYANGAFPAEFPRPLFAGWGDVRVTRDMAMGPTQTTTSTITGGVATIAAPTSTVPGNIQRTLRPGHHVWVQDSNCSNAGAPHICTVAVNNDAGTLTLAETNINSTGKLLRGLPWGIMVRKKTATGTVQVGFRYRASGAPNSSTGTAVPTCSPIEETDADGVKGHPCAIPERGGPYYMLYFISNDGDVVRPIAALGAWGVGAFRGEQISFSPTQGNVFFAKNGTSVYRITYNGNWRDSVWNTEAGRYLLNQGGDYTYFNEGLTWQPAITPDPATQIATKYPAQVSAPYPAWTSASFAGVSGDIAVMYRTINGGQDDGPCQIAVFNLLTGTLVDFLNTLEGGGPMAWGNCHSIGVNQLMPNTLISSFNILKVSNTAKISGGPYRMQVEAVQRNGEWNTNTCLEWPMTTGTQCAGVPAYDKACPAGLSAEFTEFGANGNQCVTLRLSGGPCNISPSAADTPLYGPCEWNATYTKGTPLRPGHQFVDTLTGGAAPGDAEHFRVVKVETLADGKLKVVAQRNAARDYCCAFNGTTSPEGNNCLCSNAQMTHANSWTALMVPGTKASCNVASIHVTYNDPSSPTKTYTEFSRSFQGHAAYGRGPNGTVRYLGSGVATLASFSDLGKQPPIKLSPVNTRFNGIIAPIGTYYQQYLNHSQSAASNENTIFSFDANAVNPSVGIGGNDMGNAIGPRPSSLFAQIAGDVWKLIAIDTVDYKNRPLLGWAGPKVLKDVSGPASNIASAGDYSLCYAYRNGECRGDAVAGDVFTKVPNTFKHSGWQSGWCQTGMEFANIPCVLSGGPAAGYVRQFRSDGPDLIGSDQRLLTSVLRPYGTHFPFWAAVAHPAGKIALMSSAGTLEGIRHSIFLIKLPPFRDSMRKKNTLGGLTVRVGPRPGMTHARVRFGYNTSFQCTERSEACVTDASLVPFAFAQTDALTPTGCASGCSITVPAIPGRLVYYRVEVFNGTAWSNGDTLTAAP